MTRDDPHPPEGSIHTDDGAATTESWRVKLSIAANDPCRDRGDLAQNPSAGSQRGELRMRLGNDDFDGVAWQPYQSTVEK